MFVLLLALAGVIGILLNVIENYLFLNRLINWQAELQVLLKVC